MSFFNNFTQAFSFETIGNNFADFNKMFTPFNNIVAISPVLDNNFSFNGFNSFNFDSIFSPQFNMQNFNCTNNINPLSYQFGVFNTFNTYPMSLNFGYTITHRNSSDNERNNSSDLSSLKNKHWSEMTDTQLRQIYGNYTRDITTLYNGTAEDLNGYLSGKGVLEGKGQVFIDAQERYGISAAVLVGIAMNESARGTSNLARNKNNVGGVRISGSTEFRTFESVDDCIMEMARFLKAGYVDNSGRPLTQLYQINAKYCPTSDPTDRTGNNGLWARAVDMYAGQVETYMA